MEISGIKGNKKEKALQILNEVGIDQETAFRKVLKLSGGEQQRVGIACALASDAKIICSDEPTGNLDQETEHKILELFYRLSREHKKCVIIVTHSKKVENYADVLYAITNGCVNFIR